MKPNVLAKIAIALVLIAAVLGFGAMAFNAGLGYGMAQVGHMGNAAVTGGPMVGAPHVGERFGGMPFMWGFGIFGLFGVLFKIFFIFLFFFLISRLFFWGGPRRHMHEHWRDRAKGTFEEWHKQAHATETGTTPSTPDAGTAPGNTVVNPQA